MNNQLIEIAKRIKALREIMEIPVDEMAKSCDLSKEQYLEYEAGNKDFSFTFLYKCANKFGVDLTAIMTGETSKLSSYSLVKRGQGYPITRRKDFDYENLAYLFKDRLAEPLKVYAKYDKGLEDAPIALSTHEGQEFDYILKGQLKLQIDGHSEVLYAGDMVYYDSSKPHGMVATGGEDCEFLAVVIESQSAASEKAEKKEAFASFAKPVYSDRPVYESFVKAVEDENGILKSIDYTPTENFNFAFDVVDAIAKKNPDKLAMKWLSIDKEVKDFSFGDISKMSNKAANYFVSLGVKKGDKVMLVLKRHWQFWVCIIALHKIGAIAIPATHLLTKKDFVYRFNAAGISALVCTSEGYAAEQAELALSESPTVKTLVMVKGNRENWNSFDTEITKFSDVFDRPTGELGTNKDDHMLMYFTSGTTGYPKIATHNYTYPLGHFVTAKYWHNVDPNGIHFTISDTGWAKSMWGKLYGQWLCEGAIFTYDFERFDASDLLPLFKEHGITTFCAPPTMYRFFIKENLSKYDLTSLKHCSIAGEALNPEVFAQWKSATGLSLMEGFGQTELTLVVANLVGMTPKPGSMGKPNPQYEVDLIMPDGSSAKVGEVGELIVKTDKRIPAGMFEGYYLDEAKTKEAWSDGIYHTGDTAWKDEDGFYWYVGRTDDLIKSSGYRIGPFEIESVIMELPYVLECAVTGVPDEERGQLVKATVVLTKGTVKTEELKREIQAYVKNKTAPYKYPRIVEFVDELPKTISGKIKRVDIRNNS